MAHYIVHKMIAQAALAKDIDPDNLSCQSSVEIILSKIIKSKP